MVTSPWQNVVVRQFAGHAQHAALLQTPLRIAHLTDQHVGRVTPMPVQVEAVDVTNAQQPDLVVITGDFVCHSQAYFNDLSELLKRFTAPVVCVLGNHDHWQGGDDVERALIRGGACVLRNAFTTLTLRGQQLQVVGLDDAYTGHADVRRAVEGLNPLLPSLGLSHIGEEADALWHAGVPLVLSGHTHAGQITVARLHELTLGVVGGHKYVHGLYGERLGAGAVYVGAGVGAAVMPVRLGERSKREVAVFTLGAAPGSVADSLPEQAPRTGRRPSARTQQRRADAVVKKARKRNADRGDDRS